MEKENPRVNFSELNLFRFIAAFMIIVSHAYEAWCGWFGLPGFLSQGDYKTYTKFGEYVNHAMINMTFGVDIFFLISGFLITYLLLVEKENTGSVNIKNFFIRRFLRILPLYYLLILLSPLIIKWLGNESPDYMSAIFFYNNFHTIITQQWTYPFAHFWSICIEEHFYIFWPFFILMIPVRNLPKFFALVIFISIIFRGYHTLFSPYPWFTIFLHTVSRMDMLAIGAIGAYIHHKRGLQEMFSKEIRWMIYFIFIAMFFCDTIVSWDTVFMSCFKKYFYAGVAAMAMINYQFGKGKRSSIFSNRIFSYFGKISYGIYMYGNITLLIVIKKVMLNHGINNMYFYILMIISVSLIVPVISYEIFEKQFLKLKKKFEVVKTS